MKTELLELVEKELLSEAKRLVPLVYNEKSLLKCITGKKLYNKINSRFENFYIDIELRTCRLCDMKAENKNYLDDDIELDKTIEHSNRCIKYKKENYGEDLNIVAKDIANDIINNKYENETLYSLIPTLCKKYMKTHNDSVEHISIIMLLEDALYEKGYALKSSNLKDLIQIF